MKKLNDDVDLLEKSLVYLYLNETNLPYSSSKFLSTYLSGITEEATRELKEFIQKNEITLDLELLVETFEVLLPGEEKKENGMVYTPAEIKNFIVGSSVSSKTPPTICDPACGCGSFLFTAAKFLHDKYGLSYKLIFADYLYGVDIAGHSIEKSKVLLTLLSVTEGELDEVENHFNLVVGNSLSISWDATFGKKFDLVIGNPPYVRSKNMNAKVRESLHYWETARVGNADLYIPFYELGLSLLTEKGKLGYISINTYLKSVNGRLLRRLLVDAGYETKIIDFKEEQMFKKVTSYTCITIIDKAKMNNKLLYGFYKTGTPLSEVELIDNDFEKLDKSGKNPWNLGYKKDLYVVEKLENAGVKLGSYKIRNGLATLKNNIYFFTPLEEDEKYYYREYEGTLYKIEKAICINVAKPNTMKNEEELERFMEKAIFPYYKDDNGKMIVYSEDVMQSEFPEALSFLFEVRSILDNRDKGNGKYPAWYAYGRTQGMNNFGIKLLMPYITGSPVAILSTDEDVLFYCGYALFSDDISELKFLKKILESSLFMFYIRKTSKPYSKGYWSVAKNYLIQFSIPEFSDNEKNELLKIENKEQIDSILCSKYNISLEDINN